jgi:hypothetical protein
VEPIVQYPESGHGGAFSHPHEAQVNVGRDVATCTATTIALVLASPSRGLSGMHSLSSSLA